MSAPEHTAEATPRDMQFRRDFKPVALADQIKQARADLNRLIENHELATSMGRDLDHRRKAMSPDVYARIFHRRKSVLYTLLQQAEREAMQAGER